MLCAISYISAMPEKGSGPEFMTKCRNSLLKEAHSTPISSFSDRQPEMETHTMSGVYNWSIPARWLNKGASKGDKHGGGRPKFLEATLVSAVIAA
jgi:hypothetical protein